MPQCFSWKGKDFIGLLWILAKPKDYLIKYLFSLCKDVIMPPMKGVKATCVYANFVHDYASNESPINSPMDERRSNNKSSKNICPRESKKPAEGVIITLMIPITITRAKIHKQIIPNVPII